ncbi:MAG: phospholipid/cholesterol/gamma-HCH transport system substrate-binding protein [Solirubrobacteraceae bacterium]|nr:phospholipid/cholesterol/gamma-HCH transport system substrate-binding protein [Solirubrobacteraceae bacterium]
MRTAIRKHLRDFFAILGLLLVAVVVSSVILSHQRFTLPGWVPVIGKSFYEINAELSTSAAVTPGQGQTVNVAGVQVGEITSVKLVGGRAVIGMKIEPKYDRVYKDATILMRPKTGLKDMVAELTPGTAAAGRLPAGGTIPISQTLPDVNLDEVLAALDTDTRDYLTLLLSDGGQALKGNGRALANTIRRIEPTARLSRQVNQALAQRRANIRRAVHNFSLITDELGRRDGDVANFVQYSNAVFASLASQDSALKETLRQLPSTLQVTDTTLGKATTLADTLGPTLQALRPAARNLAPTLRAVRPFVSTTTPIIRDELRPFARESLPTVQQLRPAMRDLSAATPDLTTTFKELNYLLNELAYNPPGSSDEGYLFWLSWANHLAPTVFATQDAHGPIRHGLVIFGCQTGALLSAVAASNPQLGTLVDLLNGPNRSGACPSSSQEPGSGGG